MEHKIGEIFEYNGEWYQCVESACCEECSLFTTECADGKSDIAFIIFGICSKLSRHDNRHAIFKKLEKVGEPYISADGKYCQQYQCYITPLHNRDIIYTFSDNIVVLEIKNQEEIEEKKQKMDKLVTDYSANKITYKEFEKSIVELYADKHTEVNKPKLKEFDLEAAKAGKPVCTRDGRKARIICFDVKGDKPIVALIEAKGNHDSVIEIVEGYFINGHSTFENKETDNDLMMLPERKEGWTNIYKGDLYDTLESAKENCAEDSGYIKTIKVEWEE